MNKISGQTKKPFYKRKGFLWTIGILILLVGGIAIAFKVSPWPGALVIRADFEMNDTKNEQALKKHVPDKEITVMSDQSYRQNDNDAKLDVYFAPSIKPDQKLPTIIWTHGGAWLSGDKDDQAPYYKLLASMGVTVISLDYSLAPEKTYPTAIHQINDAYKYIQDNANKFRVDTDKIMLAGDSAGAQLSAQLAAIITNPAYAKEVGITPNLKSAQLRGVILYCGIYKMEGLTYPNPALPKIIGWGDDITMWAYTGMRHPSDALIRQMSPYYHVTKDFPPAYISGGNADPLTDGQSKPLADELQNLKVDVTTEFYAADHEPQLPHEYQFNLDNDDGKKALQTAFSFIEKHVQGN